MAVHALMTTPEPEQPRPLPVIQASGCCPPNGCTFRPAMIRSYIFAFNLARIIREPPATVLADRLRGRPGEEALGVQSNRGTGSLTSRARDIVLSLERCRDELGIPLTFSNVDRLADACCRFAMEGS